MRIKTYELLNKLGCSTEDRSTLEKCMESMDTKTILKAQVKVCGNNVEGDCFVPVIDNDTVFPNDYAKNITAANKAILQGYNSNEGFLKLMKFLTEKFPVEKLSTQGFSREMFLKILARMFPRTTAQVIIACNRRSMIFLIIFLRHVL